MAIDQSTSATIAGPPNLTAHGSQSFQRHNLSNGLTVLTKEIHSAPVVSFWVWYRVGARNEHVGVTGVSHWVEHMMFKGTQSIGKGQIMQMVAENGGTLNAFTSDDWTAYFETLPADRLDLAIKIEADRMANSLFDPNEVESERTVIISEREGSENEPDRLLDEEVSSAAFKVHPYGNGIIGWKCDLRTMTRDDLYNHYRTFYVPNNATVVVAGDFDTAALLAQLDITFGAYPEGPAVPDVRAIEPDQAGERRVVVKKPGTVAQVEIVYHVPSAANPDIYPLMVADSLLSGAKPMGFGGAALGRSARLYKALVTTEIAAGAGSYFSLHKDPHLFALSASAKAGDEHVEALERMEAALYEEMRKLQEDDIPQAELEKAVRQSRAQFVYSTDSASSQAFMLGYLETIFTADMYDEILDKLSQVSADDVRRVARTYFAEHNRTVGWFIPTEDEQVAGASGAEEVA
jgi:zinc protease